jgi:hypothetical protein
MKKNIKLRVAKACYLLKDINRKELSPELFDRLNKVLKEVSKNGNKQKKYANDVIGDVCENSTANRHKKLIFH